MKVAGVGQKTISLIIQQCESGAAVPRRRSRGDSPGCAMVLGSLALRHWLCARWGWWSSSPNLPQRLVVRRVSRWLLQAGLLCGR